MLYKVQDLGKKNTKKPAKEKVAKKDDSKSVSASRIPTLKNDEAIRAMIAPLMEYLNEDAKMLIANNVILSYTNKNNVLTITFENGLKLEVKNYTDKVKQAYNLKSPIKFG